MLSPPALPAQPFSADFRIRRRAEFDHVFSTGTKFHGRYVTVVIAQRPSGPARLGLVASRKVGNAVRRNRAKRLIREVFRTQICSTTAAVDVVVIPKREFFDADFAALTQDVRATVRRHKVRAPRHAS